jgi:hypothetical protein
VPTNSRKARLELYDHARKTLAAQPLSASEIKRELRALEPCLDLIEPRRPGRGGRLAQFVRARLGHLPKN